MGHDEPKDWGIEMRLLARIEDWIGNAIFYLDWGLNLQIWAYDLDLIALDVDLIVIDWDLRILYLRDGFNSRFN